MKNKIFKILLPAIGLLIFIIALFVLYDQLKNYKFHQIMYHLKNISANKILLSVLFTVISYFAMTFYDFFAVKYINKKMPYTKIGLTSLTAYIFSNNIGFSLFSGSAVRFRFYSVLGLTSVDIVQIITFTNLTFWLGLFSSAGFTYIVKPLAVPEFLHIHLKSTFPVGILFILIIVIYILFSIFFKKPVKIKGWELYFPSLRLTIYQLIISISDWAAAGLVLYVLLPGSNLNFFMFFNIFMLAQTIGLISHVPQGIGVFESIIMFMLSGSISPTEIFSALIIYRLIYYLIPLLFGIAIFLLNEVLIQKEKAIKFFHAFGKWFPEIFPSVLSILIFFSGVVLIVSGVTPGEMLRLKWLDLIMPIHIVEISHFLGSLSGVALLIISYSILKRLDISYYITLILLFVGSIFSILKGLDYEEAIILIAIFFTLLFCKNFFYRKASFFNQALSPLWIIAIFTVIICSIWIGFFIYKHVEYSNDLWWQFEFSNNASRFLRSTFGIVVFLFVIALLRLLKSHNLVINNPNEYEFLKVKEIIKKSKYTYVNLALLNDKYFLFDVKYSAFLMYNISGNSWISMGDPVGEKEGINELIWQFKELSLKSGFYPVFYEVGQDNLNLYIELGLSLLKIGEEAKVDLNNFSLEGKHFGDLRYALNKFSKEDYKFEIIEKNDSIKYFKEFKNISDLWLKQKKMNEKKFSLGYFNENYLKNFKFAVIKKDEKILAFTNILQTDENYEISIDLMRYSNDAPKGIMDYLFTSLLFWCKENNYKWFNLGLAPLSGLINRSYAPMWNKIASLVFNVGKNFYNFQGLRTYKEKFKPEWFPKYIASTGGFAFPKILTDITVLIGSGVKEIKLK